MNEKYLGDFQSELGCKQSIDDTIKYRIQKLTSKANDILLIADAPQLGAEGTSTAAIKLFEAQVMSGLLFNCESWIGITDAQIDELQRFQDNFLKKLLHLPISTPKAILHWCLPWAKDSDQVVCIQYREVDTSQLSQTLVNKTKFVGN